MTETNNSPIAIGKRLKALRIIAKLKRVDLATMANVSKPSITYWEHGQINSPIKSKSMAKMLGAFKKAGIIITERWLRTGEGELPTYEDGTAVVFKEELLPFIAGHKETAPALKRTDIATNLATIFSEEIKLFAALEQAVMLKVEHNGLAPYIEKGDLVGGIWQPGLNVTREKVCIFSINNQLQVGCIKKRTEENLFDLIYTNPAHGITGSTTSSLFLEEVAPVLRVWR